jgi:gliding motility-associated-like protein
MRKFFTYALSMLFFFSAWSEEIKTEKNAFACAVDVVILEGSTISFCQGQPTSINASAGFAAYSWTGPQTGMTSALIPTSSGVYTVTAVDGIGCLSSASIAVTINPNPAGVIISSEGTLLCPGSSGTILSLTQPFATYLWGNGSSNSTFQATQAGTYSVICTDGNGCSGNSSITISQPNFTFNPSETTTVCNGSTATLVAGGGTSYLWSTGELGPTIVVSPVITTTYSVTITSGLCSQSFSQIITSETLPDSEIEDTFYIGVGDEVFINGPNDYTTYNWTPATDLTQYNSQDVTFIGSQSTQYTVNSSHTNGCMRSDDILVIVVQLTIPTGFSPNGDLVNDTFIIPELETYKGHITIFNRWGDKVFENSSYQNDWNGTCQTEFCLGKGPLPEGTYFYSIEVEKVHFDGFVTLKY